jgi:selenide,water dikinase
MLKQLQGSENPDILVGPETMDDAGVFRLSAELALVQTADFITPVSDDAFRFGQVAAANSLSDVYAMGGRAVTALNLCCFPGCNVDPDLLTEILKGGFSKIEEAGAALMGGHTVEDEDLKYGLSVTGVVNPEKMTPNSGAVAGDFLILTKPLGTGIMITADQWDMLRPGEFDSVLDSMATLNARGAEIAAEFEVRGATDITGFALMGHAFEMANASGVRIQLHFDALPYFERVLELDAKGATTKVTPTNASLVKPFATYGAGLSNSQKNLVHDPQTSGGLLLAVSGGKNKAEELVIALREAGMISSEIVGEVVEGEPHVEIG